MAHSKATQDAHYRVTERETAARFVKSVLTDQGVLPGDAPEQDQELDVATPEEQEQDLPSGDEKAQLRPVFKDTKVLDNYLRLS